jgi:hypothetical protein
VILAPRRFLRETDQVQTREVMMVADLGAAHAAEKALRIVAVDAVAKDVRLLKVESVQSEGSM